MKPLYLTHSIAQIGWLSGILFLLIAAAPASASPDAYEQDDTPQTAKVILLNTQIPEHYNLPGYEWHQTRNFYEEGDADWVKFSGIEDQLYQVTAYIDTLAPGMDPVDGQNCDPVIHIYADDGETLLHGPIDRGLLGETEKMEAPWACPYTGLFYILISQCDPNELGCNASYGEGTSYQLELTQPYMTIQMVHGRVTLESETTPVNTASVITSAMSAPWPIDNDAGDYALPHIAGNWTFTASAPKHTPFKKAFSLPLGQSSIKINARLTQDLCPNDPDKNAPGICGCGVSDSDSFGDMDGNEAIDLSDAVNALRLLAGHDDGLSPQCAARVGLDWAIHVLKKIAK